MDHHPNANGTETKVCNLITIDLSNPDIHQLVALIKQACTETGMFYVTNHGLSIEDMDKTFQECKKFFSLSMDEKKKLIGKKYLRGYRAPLFKDYVESLTSAIGTTEADEPTNIWPPADILPGWKETIRKYQLATFNVGREICKLMALALDLNIDFFDQPKLLGKENGSFCSILHYGDEEKDSSEKLGSVIHTDAYLITLVTTDHNLGLQVCLDKHANPQVWESILPKKGAFIVNVADVLERISNDKFISILHRVIHRNDRHCIAVFLAPNYNYVIECVNPPKYPPTHFVDFVASNYKEVADEIVKSMEA